MDGGSILGYDLNEKYCQISFYNDIRQEPETLEVFPGSYQIPLLLGRLDGKWIYVRVCVEAQESESGRKGL